MRISAKENKTLDVFKMLACLLVVGLHMPQLFGSGMANAYYNQWLARFCVPFFFVSSGYFFEKSAKKEKSIFRIGLLFLVSYVLYLPYILKTNPDSSLPSRLAWNALFGYEHLWYISAALEGMIVWYLAEKIPGISWLFRKIGFAAAMVLLLLGALTDEYYKLLNVGPLTALAEFLLIFGGPRNVVFLGFPMLMIGRLLARQEEKVNQIPTVVLGVGLALSFGLSFGECAFLFSKLGTGISNDITLFNAWPAVFLFLLSFRIPVNISEDSARKLRKISEYVYVLHLMAGELLGRTLQVIGLTRWFLTVVVCVALSLLLIRLKKIPCKTKKATG